MNRIASISTAVFMTCSFLSARCDLSEHNLDYKKVNHLSSTTAFNTALQEADYVFVKFSASWCGPCKQLAPIVAQLAKQFENVLFIDIDYNAFTALAKSYSVRNIPSIFLFKKGQQVNRVVGTGHNWSELIQNSFGI